MNRLVSATQDARTATARKVQMTRERILKRAKISPEELRHSRRLFSLFFDSDSPRFPEVMPTELKDRLESSWHWDSYATVHLLPFFKRYARLLGKTLFEIAEPEEETSDVRNDLKGKLVCSMHLSFSYQSASVTSWFSGYSTQFPYFYDWLLRRIKQKSEEKKLLIRDFGCSSGEETYLIAMLVRSALETIGRSLIIQDLGAWVASWDIKIIGYSINPYNLECAEEGRFFSSEHYPFDISNYGDLSDPLVLRNKYISFQKLGLIPRCLQRPVFESHDRMRYTAQLAAGSLRSC